MHFPPTRAEQLLSEALFELEISDDLDLGYYESCACRAEAVSLISFRAHQSHSTYRVLISVIRCLIKKSCYTGSREATLSRSRVSRGIHSTKIYE